MSSEAESMSETQLEGANNNQNEKRSRTLTKKGQLYTNSMKVDHVRQAVKGLEKKFNEVELIWIDVDCSVLRNVRHDLEKFRGILEIALSEFNAQVSDSAKVENSALLEQCSRLNDQALELRKKIGERIFELEKGESRSRMSRSTSVKSSKRSLKDLKVFLAKSEVDMKFSRIQAEYELDLQRKRFEFEQLEKLKYYETVKAEKNAIEEFEKTSSLTEENLSQLGSQDDFERVSNFLLSFNGQSACNKSLLHNNASNLDTNKHKEDTCKENVNNFHDNVNQRSTTNSVTKTGNQSNDINLDGRRDNVTNPSINNGNAPTVCGNTKYLRNQTLRTGSPPTDPALHTGSPVLNPTLHTGSPVLNPPLHTGSPVLNPTLYTGSPARSQTLHTGSPPTDPALHSGSPDRHVNETSNIQMNSTNWCNDRLTLIPPAWFSQHHVPMSTPQMVHASQGCSFQSVQDIGFAIAEGMQASRLPSPQLSVFTGNPLEWPSWKATFETVIERRTTTDSERILYLQQYLAGEPKKIIEGYQFVPSSEAYEEAKSKLERRFGNPSVVADAFRQRLSNWPRIPPKDGKELRSFADFLKTCELAMHSVEDLESLNKQHENKQLLKTLPSWMHSKWGSKVRLPAQAR